MKYTKEQEARLVELVGTPVKDIATELGFTERSIIAKMSKMGIYQKPERLTKTGDPVVSKLELLTDIEQTTNLTLPSLLKCHKADLKKLLEYITK